MYNSISTRWSFHFAKKIQALCNFDQVSIYPCLCPSFQQFSKEKHAYIMQTTFSTDDQWIPWHSRWTNRCYATFFTIKCFTECKAKALRSVIIANIPSILSDSFSQQNIGSQCQIFPRNFQKIGSLHADLHWPGIRFSDQKAASTKCNQPCQEICSRSSSLYYVDIQF